MKLLVSFIREGMLQILGKAGGIAVCGFQWVWEGLFWEYHKPANCFVAGELVRINCGWVTDVNKDVIKCGGVPIRHTD